MSSNRLVETSTNLIIDKIKADIADALLDIRTDRADAAVTTELPRAYYTYNSAFPYRCPAVFVVCESVDFNKDFGANHVNAIVKMRVAVIVEDKDLRLLTIKAYRYQAALHKILNQTQLINNDNSVLLTTIIRGATFSPEFTLAQVKDEGRGMFQKEVALDIDCIHREKF